MLTPIKKQCLYPSCKKKFVPSGPNQKYCCRVCANKHLADVKQANGYSYRKCAWCGTNFKSYDGEKCCSETCKKEFEEFREWKKKTKTHKHRGYTPKQSLAEINELARKEGLTYGQYFNKHVYGGWF